MKIEDIRYEDTWISTLDDGEVCRIHSFFQSMLYGMSIMVIPLRNMERYNSIVGMIPMSLEIFLKKYEPILET